MNRLSILSASLAAALTMLAACGGSQPPIGAPGALPQARNDAGMAPDHLPGQLTFKFTGRPQTWRVPKKVRTISVVGFGAAGDGTGGAGLGGRASAILPVQPGEKLTIVVGGNAYKSQGGYNGGGPGGNYNGRGFGFGGGGSTDIREHGSLLSDRIFVVGGGGGQGAYDQYSGRSEGKGGKGGGRIGGSGGIGFGIFEIRWRGRQRWKATPRWHAWDWIWNRRIGRIGREGSAATWRLWRRRLCVVLLLLWRRRRWWRRLLRRGWWRRRQARRNPILLRWRRWWGRLFIRSADRFKIPHVVWLERSDARFVGTQMVIAMQRTLASGAESCCWPTRRLSGL